MQISCVDVSLSLSVRSLGVVLDQTLSFFALSIPRVAYLDLRRISTVCRYLSVDATLTIICDFFLSRIFYCNSLLAGIPKCLG